MRKLLLLIAVPLLFSCSIMKHKKESHKESSTEITQGSSSSAASLDTSKTTTNEYWRFSFPGAKLNVQPTAQTFPDFSLPDFTGASDAQRAALLELQKNYSSLQSVNKDQAKVLEALLSGQTGLLIEMLRQTQENAYKSTNEQKQDSLVYKHSEKQDESEKEKKEQIPLWQVIVLTVLATIIITKVFK